MKFISLLLSSIIVLNIFAQDTGLKYEAFKWEKNPQLHKLTEAEKKLPQINILKEYSEEFAQEGESVFEFSFFHKIVKVNTDDAIQENNKIYIPVRSNNKLLKTMARVINSKGEVKELNEDDIKESVDEDSKLSYKYFALKGVDIGSEIEFFYYTKEYPELSGAKYTFQSETPTKTLKFELIAPTHLHLIFKSYNGLSQIQRDTLVKDKNRWFFEQKDIPELKAEPMSSYKSNLQSLIYKLDKNTYSGKSNLYNYSQLSQNYFTIINEEISKKTEKKIKSIGKDSGASAENDLYLKIRKLEQFIKTNYTYQSFSHQDLSNLEYILENKIANKNGLMKLYTACFKYLEIKNELVLTSNRFNSRFDKDFESYSFLISELFYIKKLGKYLLPLDITSRFGYIPFGFTNTYALFIKPVSLGEFNSAVGKIKFIEPLSHELSTDTLNINIDFNKDDINNPEISYTKSQKGLDIMSIQPIYDYIEGEIEEELDESIAKFINADIEVEDIKIENKGGENFGIKPFKISAKLKTTDFVVENAGTKYLFKIGELIGPQMEMYQEKGTERKLDVEMNYNHSYYRTITFNIPEGYVINNLDDLNFNVSLEYEGEKSSFFISSYILKDNKIIMKNEEVYNKIGYPRELFEKYRNVINAAADFNKVVLILEKK